MAEQHRLAVAAVQPQVSALQAFLSQADVERLAALFACFSSPQASQVSLAAGLAAVASGRSLDKQLADFRAFRQRLHKASSKAGLG